jgi:hypothetical protein
MQNLMRNTKQVPQTLFELRSSIEELAATVENFTNLPDWDSFSSVSLIHKKPDAKCIINITNELDKTIAVINVVNAALSRGLRWRIYSITSLADRRLLRKFWGFFFFIFVLGACAMFYWDSLPISTFEDLNKISGQIDKIQVQKTGGGKQPDVFYLNIVLHEQPDTTFWSQLQVQELSQKLKPGMMTELWVNPDFRVGMKKGEIRQISAEGKLLLSYPDWVRWKERDNKVVQWFAIILIILACLSGYYAFKPRRAGFKTFSEVQAARKYVLDAAQRLVSAFKAVESESQWQSLADIRRYKNTLGMERLKLADDTLSEFKSSLKTLNQVLKKIGSQLNA